VHRPRTRVEAAPPSRWRWVTAVLGVVSLGLPFCLPSAAGASYHGSPGHAAAVGDRVGALTVVDAFLPQPASPDVAAIYLTVKNAGGRPDALVSASSASASSSILMTENPNGTMGLLRALRIPAHGRASLVPGRDHLMLEQPDDPLSVGQHVLVTLRFRRAGTLTISVPVVPLSRIESR
jgi:periplasmic copper chaperone A